MALTSRRREGGEPPGPDEGDAPAAKVEVTIAGPDAERLGSLIDTSVLANLLRRRAAEAEAADEQ